MEQLLTILSPALTTYIMAMCGTLAEQMNGKHEQRIVLQRVRQLNALASSSVRGRRYATCSPPPRPSALHKRRCEV